MGFKAHSPKRVTAAHTLVGISTSQIATLRFVFLGMKRQGSHQRQVVIGVNLILPTLNYTRYLPSGSGMHESHPGTVRRRMNNKPKRRISKEERKYLEKKERKEMILDTIVLAVVVIGTILFMAFILGRLDGANCN